MKYAVFILSPFLWLVRIAVFVLFAIPGLGIVAALAWGGVYAVRPSRRFPGRSVTQFPWWVWPYGNDEDGVDGLRGGSPDQKWWADKTASMSQARRIWQWAAVRNPVDNLRWVPLLNPKIDPSRVRFVGMDHEPAKGEGGWYFAWQGFYSCLRWESKTWRLWIGAKLKPTDRLGIDPSDPRAIRCDFALQFKRIRP